MKISKFKIAIAALLTIMLMAGSSFASEKGLKIATLSIQQIIDQSKSGQEARKVLEAKQSELQPKFKEEQETLQAQAKEIEKKSSVWSEEVKAKKEREYQKNMREYQLKAEDAQYELKQLEKKVLDPIFKELQKIIIEIGKRDGYSMVFEKSRSGGMLFADDALDISDSVMKELDAKQSK